MSISKKNTDLIDQVINQAWNQGNLDAVDEGVSDDYVLEDPAFEQEVRGANGFKQLIRSFRTAFPDLEFTINDRVVGEDEVADRYTITGTHKGELMGMEPTGKKVEVQGMVIHRFKDGKVVEDRATSDFLGMMKQLGVIQSMPLRFD